MKRIIATLLLLVGTCGATAQAGQSGEALSACLKTSATQDDRRVLVQWIYAAISVHPDLQAMTRIDADDRAKLEKDAAAIFERLIAVDCTALARQTIVSEGSEGFGNAFKTLGELAMGGVVENPDVQVGMSRLGGMINHERMLKALLSK
ncbi:MULTISPECIES: hypothetical protein [unclassified Lysobacter]|uniref:hypothetical protein n=1 Tax=unclassified Lysobacter TaxID=2635362 RepID=UPI001C22BB72|nr:hypothetical protein [Lysobacter sp. MMG2]MBU8975126.1 hypothetical protein [Lysobacter sp. MMG2]